MCQGNSGCIMMLLMLLLLLLNALVTCGAEERTAPMRERSALARLCLLAHRLTCWRA